jgi:hypothetical protein
MNLQRFLRAVLAATVLMAATPAAAQSTVTSADIQRLQDQIFQTGSDISRMRSGDSTTATQLEGELDELREEVIYLKVKMRKNGTVTRTEYADVRDRLQDLRSRARGDSRGSRDTYGRGGVSGGVSGGTSGGVYGEDQNRTRGGRSVIPEGQEIDVRLQTQLSSGTAQVEDRFEATTVVDLYSGNDVLIPEGSVLRGVISSVDRASRTDRKGAITVAFDQITIRGRSYPIRGTVTQALESEGIKGEAARVGAGSAVGAIIGGILGGVKGALLGVLIGGGGTIAATEGKDVTLPAGTVLRVRLDTPPNIR